MKRRNQNIIILMVLLFLIAVIYIMSPSGIPDQPITGVEMHAQMEQLHLSG